MQEGFLELFSFLFFFFLTFEQVKPTRHFISYTMLVPGWTLLCFQNCLNSFTASQTCFIGLTSGDYRGHLSSVNSLTCLRPVWDDLNISSQKQPSVDGYTYVIMATTILSQVVKFKRHSVSAKGFRVAPPKYPTSFITPSPQAWRIGFWMDLYFDVVLQQILTLSFECHSRKWDSWDHQTFNALNYYVLFMFLIQSKKRNSILWLHRIRIIVAVQINENNSS